MNHRLEAFASIGRHSMDTALLMFQAVLNESQAGSLRHVATAWPSSDKQWLRNDQPTLKEHCLPKTSSSGN